MKNECKIISDLLPLYLENLVCKETEEFIKNHLSECENCREDFEELKSGADLKEVFKEEAKTEAEDIKPFKKVMKKMNMQVHSISYLLIIFFIFFGFLSMDSGDVFYNSLIMPIVGVFGYIIFRFKAFYKLPVLLLVINLLACLLNLADVEFIDIFFWTAIFTAFVDAGIIIAFLIHFAFRKEK
ncbi:MAG: zf-HC2 domain-containing protein [Ruminococcaceae bacterium]|nr:zf-HC2 domain-containing protein [Oscillospiraceae bacterium]